MDEITAENIGPRLRERAGVARGEKTGTADADAVYFEAAADEIERLRAALTLIAGFGGKCRFSNTRGSDGDQAYREGSHAAWEQAAGIAASALKTADALNILTTAEAPMYDTKCFDLAEAFLEDHPEIDTDAHRHELAQLIQTTIEDQLSSWSSDANEAAYECQQDALMESGGGPTLMEQAQAAWKIKHGLR